MSEIQLFWHYARLTAEFHEAFNVVLLVILLSFHRRIGHIEREVSRLAGELNGHVKTRDKVILG